MQFITSDILFKYPDLPDPQFHFCKMNEEDNINSMSIEQPGAQDTKVPGIHEHAFKGINNSLLFYGM